MRTSSNISLLVIIIASSASLGYYVHSPWAFGPASMYKQRPENLVRLLEDLKSEINLLPVEAFLNPMLAEQRRRALVSLIDAVVKQVEASAYTGAMKKLNNLSILVLGSWTIDPWKAELIEKINDVIDAFGQYL